MENGYGTDEKETKEKQEKKTNWSFLRGMTFGAVMTFACFWGIAFYFRMQTGRSQSAYTQPDTELTTQESPEKFDLDETAISRKLNEMEQIIDKNYLDAVDADAVEEGLYSGLAAGLGDPYSAYYSVQNLEVLDESTKGIYTGIGATMQQDPETGAISVISVFDGTPAAEAGLLPNDVLVKVNGQSIEGMDLSEVVAQIKTEEGETVVLDLLRDGEECSLPVTRREIRVPTVEYEMLEEQIGYLQILEFDDVTLEQTKEALEALEGAGMEKLIVDLRDNPGGVLDVVCSVLDLFLPKCRLVYTEYKDGTKDEFFAKDNRWFEKPLAVLINGNSASASEIFAGAIRDYEAGTLVGTTTFGKGIVQRVFNLSDGSGLKLTIAKYYTPNGQYIQDKGIDPDVEVELDEALQGKLEITHEEDNQLREAIRVLKEAS